MSGPMARASVKRSAAIKELTYCVWRCDNPTRLRSFSKFLAPADHCAIRIRCGAHSYWSVDTKVRQRSQCPLRPRTPRPARACTEPAVRVRSVLSSGNWVGPRGLVEQALSRPSHPEQPGPAIPDELQLPSQHEPPAMTKQLDSPLKSWKLSQPAHPQDHAPRAEPASNPLLAHPGSVHVFVLLLCQSRS